MSVEERMLIDTLGNIARSMSKVAAELATIREMMAFDRKVVLKEARLANRKNGQVVEPSKFDKKDAIANIRDIRNGSYLK